MALPNLTQSTAAGSSRGCGCEGRVFPMWTTAPGVGVTVTLTSFPLPSGSDGVAGVVAQAGAVFDLLAMNTGFKCSRCSAGELREALGCLTGPREPVDVYNGALVLDGVCAHDADGVAIAFLVHVHGAGFVFAGATRQEFCATTSVWYAHEELEFSPSAARVRALPSTATTTFPLRLTPPVLFSMRLFAIVVNAVFQGCVSFSHHAFSSGDAATAKVLFEEVAEAHEQQMRVASGGLPTQSKRRRKHSPPAEPPCPEPGAGTIPTPTHASEPEPGADPRPAMNAGTASPFPDPFRSVVGGSVDLGGDWDFALSGVDGAEGGCVPTPWGFPVHHGQRFLALTHSPPPSLVHTGDYPDNFVETANEILASRPLENLMMAAVRRLVFALTGVRPDPAAHDRNTFLDACVLLRPAARQEILNLMDLSAYCPTESV